MQLFFALYPGLRHCFCRCIRLNLCTLKKKKHAKLMFVVANKNDNRELKQRRRRRLRKRYLKSEFALPQTLSRLFYLV